MRTVMRRRGTEYRRYLVTAVALPQLAYCCAPAVRVWSAVTALWHRASGKSLADAERLHDLRITSEGDGTAAPIVPSAVEALMDRVHAAGMTGVRHGFNGLVMCADGTARLRRLKGLRAHAGRGVVFAAERDADRVAFNARFAASILTEETARQLLREHKASVPAGYRDYAPIDFGGGVTIGRIASTDSGTGRWDFFNRHIVTPLVTGRRVLDLGSNNGSLPLMMLRAGAASVVAVEGSPAVADFARLNARILEWRDIRRYDIRVITGDMRLFLTPDLGQFDVVTAFCSLYYLPECDMARIIAKAAAMRATLVLQANDAIHNLPASGSELRLLMTSNGYPNVDMHQFPGFARPLLVGAPQIIGDAAASERAWEAVPL
ncbi:MAG: hypothetical protein DMF84_04370 [Acidobacteria bacterium]|nr:MAG: hypothetical protein DMF84_04370 [Acidobacteriota bacterium]